jgi:hypothetical protein
MMRRLNSGSEGIGVADLEPTRHREASRIATLFRANHPMATARFGLSRTSRFVPNFRVGQDVAFGWTVAATNREPPQGDCALRLS